MDVSFGKFSFRLGILITLFVSVSTNHLNNTAGTPRLLGFIIPGENGARPRLQLIPGAQRFLGQGRRIAAAPLSRLREIGVEGLPTAARSSVRSVPFNPRSVVDAVRRVSPGGAQSATGATSNGEGRRRANVMLVRPPSRSASAAGLTPDVLRQIRQAIRTRGSRRGSTQRAPAVPRGRTSSTSSSSASSSSSSSSSSSQSRNVTSARPRTREELIATIRRRINAARARGSQAGGPSRVDQAVLTSGIRPVLTTNSASQSESASSSSAAASDTKSNVVNDRSGLSRSDSSSSSSSSSSASSSSSSNSNSISSPASNGAGTGSLGGSGAVTLVGETGIPAVPVVAVGTETIIARPGVQVVPVIPPTPTVMTEPQPTFVDVRPAINPSGAVGSEPTATSILGVPGMQPEMAVLPPAQTQFVDSTVQSGIQFQSGFEPPVSGNLGVLPTLDAGPSFQVVNEVQPSLLGGMMATNIAAAGTSGIQLEGVVPLAGSGSGIINTPPEFTAAGAIGRVVSVGGNGNIGFSNMNLGFENALSSMDGNFNSMSGSGGNTNVQTVVNTNDAVFPGSLDANFGSQSLSSSSSGSGLVFNEVASNPTSTGVNTDAIFSAGSNGPVVSGFGFSNDATTFQTQPAGIIDNVVDQTLTGANSINVDWGLGASPGQSGSLMSGTNAALETGSSQNAPDLGRFDNIGSGSFGTTNGGIVNEAAQFGVDSRSAAGNFDNTVTGSFGATNDGIVNDVAQFVAASRLATGSLDNTGTGSFGVTNGGIVNEVAPFGSGSRTVAGSVDNIGRGAFGATNGGLVNDLALFGEGSRAVTGSVDNIRTGALGATNGRIANDVVSAQFGADSRTVIGAIPDSVSQSGPGRQTDNVPVPVPFGLDTAAIKVAVEQAIKDALMKALGNQAGNAMPDVTELTSAVLHSQGYGSRPANKKTAYAPPPVQPLTATTGATSQTQGKVAVNQYVNKETTKAATKKTTMFVETPAAPKATSHPQAYPAGETKATPPPQAYPAGETKATPPPHTYPVGETKATPPPQAYPAGETKATPPPQAYLAGETKATPPPQAYPTGATKETPPPKAHPVGETKATPPPKAYPTGATKATSPPQAYPEGETKATTPPQAYPTGESKATTPPQAYPTGATKATPPPQVYPTGATKATPPPQAYPTGATKATSPPQAYPTGATKATSPPQAYPEVAPKTTSPPQAYPTAAPKTVSPPQANLTATTGATKQTQSKVAVNQYVNKKTTKAATKKTTIFVETPAAPKATSPPQAYLTATTGTPTQTQGKVAVNQYVNKETTKAATKKTTMFVETPAAPKATTPQAYPTEAPKATTPPQAYPTGATKATTPPQAYPTGATKATSPPQAYPTGATKATTPPHAYPTGATKATTPPQAYPEVAPKATSPPQAYPTAAPKTVSPPQAYPTSLPDVPKIYVVPDVPSSSKYAQHGTQLTENINAVNGVQPIIQTSSVHVTKTTTRKAPGTTKTTGTSKDSSQGSQRTSFPGVSIVPGNQGLGQSKEPAFKTIAVENKLFDVNKVKEASARSAEVRRMNMLRDQPLTTNARFGIDSAGGSLKTSDTNLFTAPGQVDVTRNSAINRNSGNRLPLSGTINVDMSFLPSNAQGRQPNTGLQNPGIASVQTDGAFLGLTSGRDSQIVSSSARTKFHDQSSLLAMVSEQISKRQQPLAVPAVVSMSTRFTKKPSFETSRMPFTGPASAWDMEPKLPNNLDLVIPQHPTRRPSIERVDLPPPPLPSHGSTSRQDTGLLSGFGPPPLTSHGSASRQDNGLLSGFGITPLPSQGSASRQNTGLLSGFGPPPLPSQGSSSRQDTGLLSGFGPPPLPSQGSASRQDTGLLSGFGPPPLPSQGSASRQDTGLLSGFGPPPLPSQGSSSRQDTGLLSGFGPPALPSQGSSSRQDTGLLSGFEPVPPTTIRPTTLKQKTVTAPVFGFDPMSGAGIFDVASHPLPQNTVDLSVLNIRRDTVISTVSPPPFMQTDSGFNTFIEPVITTPLPISDFSGGMQDPTSFLFDPVSAPPQTISDVRVDIGPPPIDTNPNSVMDNNFNQLSRKNVPLMPTDKRPALDLSNTFDQFSTQAPFTFPPAFGTSPIPFLTPQTTEPPIVVTTSPTNMLPTTPATIDLKYLQINETKPVVPAQSVNSNTSGSDIPAMQYDMAPFQNNENWAIFDPTSLPPGVNFSDFGPIIELPIDSKVQFTSTNEAGFQDIFSQAVPADAAAQPVNLVNNNSINVNNTKATGVTEQPVLNYIDVTQSTKLANPPQEMTVDVQTKRQSIEIKPITNKAVKANNRQHTDIYSIGKAEIMRIPPLNGAAGVSNQFTADTSGISQFSSSGAVNEYINEPSFGSSSGRLQARIDIPLPPPPPI